MTTGVKQKLRRASRRRPRRRAGGRGGGAGVLHRAGRPEPAVAADCPPAQAAWSWGIQAAAS